MKPFEEIREAITRAILANNDTAIDYAEIVLFVLAAHGIDVRRIAAGELKVLAREPTEAMRLIGDHSRGRHFFCSDCYIDSRELWIDMWHHAEPETPEDDRDKFWDAAP